MKYKVLYDFELTCDEADSKYTLSQLKNKIDLAVMEFDISYAYEISKDQTVNKPSEKLH